MVSDDILFRGALTLALGLIIGFQRERNESALAGIRTFPLFALSGFFCALLESAGTSFVVTGGLLALAGLISVMNIRRAGEDKRPGLTTEISALFVFLMGAAFALLPRVELIVAAGGVCALLLHLKEPMHGLVSRMKWNEVHAVMQFVLVAFIIFPLLPDKAYDKYGVLNLQEIWLMVVLITGISMVSYTIQKLKNSRAGTVWTGALGGLISSTAATVTLSRTSAQEPKLVSVAPAIIIATGVAYVRVLSEILIVAPEIFGRILLPLSGILGIMIVSCTTAYYQISREKGAPPPPGGNPSQLKAAIVFGVLFAGILYLSSWTRSEFGEKGLYAVSLISGLIDVDAITLSTTQLIKNHTITSDLGWRLIVVAFFSNVVFKGGMVAVMARGRARKIVIIHFLLSTIAGGLIVYFA